MNPQIIGLHHAQITVPTGAEWEARAFYLGVLGLTEIPKPESLQGRGGFWMTAGTAPIHVGVEDGVDRQASKAHLAYQVAQLQAWRDELIRHEIQPLDSIPIPGFARFEFRDPFGNRVEMIEPIDD